ncbi:MAG: L-threonylcarbamoyladenylate synthase [Acidimicrobiales bacterium]
MERFLNVESMIWSEVDRDGLVDAAWGFLERGLVVGVATDTVVGLCAAPWRPDGIARIYELKQRPADRALPILVASAHDIPEYFIVDDEEYSRLDTLACRFWPGALTIVVHGRPRREWTVGSPIGTIGFRSPGPSAASAIIGRAPVACTSGNLHGVQPPLDTRQLMEALGGTARRSLAEAGLAMVIDGSSPGGRSSTVVDVTLPRFEILREGPVGSIEIEQCLEVNSRGG